MKTKWILFNYVMVATLSTLLMLSCSEGPADDGGNSGPGVEIAVTLVSPADEAEGVAASPIFEWSTDQPDLKDVTYTLYFGNDPKVVLPVQSEITDLTYDLPYSLLLGSKGYWKVSAEHDGYSFESELQSFNVAAFESPVLTAPAQGALVASEVTFEWETIDFTDIIYTLHFIPTDAVDGEGEFTIEVPTADAASYTATAEDIALFTDLKSYNWWLTASDGANISTSAEKFTFDKIVPGAPLKPVLTAPAAYTVFDMSTTSVDLTWDAAYDPEGDAVTYSIEVIKGIEKYNIATGISETSFSYDISGDADGTEFVWTVTATDGTFSTASTSSSFYKTSGGQPLRVNPLKTIGLLSLAEPFVWENAGDAFTYTVKLFKDGAWSTLASAISNTTYTLKNSAIPCDVVSGAKEFKIQIIASDGTTERKSIEIPFKPEMEGTFIDKRGAEAVEYGWVRVGPYVWMQQNLRTEFLNDGTPLVSKANSHLAPSVSTGDNPENVPTFYVTSTDNMDMCYDKLTLDGIWELTDEDKEAGYTLETKAGDAHYDFFTGTTHEDFVNELDKFINKAGYVYPLWTACNDKIAPAGWHVPTYEELKAWHIYYGLDQDGEIMKKYYDAKESDLMKFMDQTYFGGTNEYKLSLVPSPMRGCKYPGWSGGNNKGGFTRERWQFQGNLWVLNTSAIEKYANADAALVDDYINGVMKVWNRYPENVSHRWYIDLAFDNGKSTKWGTSYYKNTPAIFYGIRCIMD